MPSGDIEINRQAGAQGGPHRRGLREARRLRAPVSEKEAERRAWATFNKESGGGKQSGSGRGRKDTRTSSEHQGYP